MPSAARSRQLLARSSGASRLSSVKAEPVEAVIPRKRASDIPIRLKKEDSVNRIGAPFSTPPAKRVKSEVHDIPKTPLRPVNREPSFGDTSSSGANMFNEQLSEMSLMLNDIDRQLNHIQLALSQMEQKPYRTQADEAEIAQLEAEVYRLLELRDDIASIQSVPSATLRFGPSTHEPAPAYNTHYHTQYQSGPSGSDVQLPPAFQNPAFAQQRNVIVDQGLPQVNAPVASGSRVKLEAQVGYAEMEIDSLDLDFRPVTAGIPGMPQPLSDDERFDQDGNFYGRGRDMFNGPQARADE